MSDFISTVTITLKEYDQLRRDAAPVQLRRQMGLSCMTEAYHEYFKFADRPNGALQAERERLGRYLRYMIRCFDLGATPAPYGAYEVWMRPGEHNE